MPGRAAASNWCMLDDRDPVPGGRGRAKAGHSALSNEAEAGGMEAGNSLVTRAGKVWFGR